MVLVTILKLVFYPLIYLALVYVLNMPMVMNRLVAVTINNSHLFTRQRVMLAFSFIYLMVVIILESGKVIKNVEGFDDAQVSVLRGYVKKADTSDVDKTIDFLKKFGDIVKKDKETKVVGQNLKEFANWLKSNRASPQERVAVVNALNNQKNGGDIVPQIMIENVVRAFVEDKKMTKEEAGELLGVLVQIYKWKNDIEEKKAEERLQALEEVKLQEQRQDIELEEKQKEEARKQVEVVADPREQGKEEVPVEKVPEPSNTPSANDTKEQFANVHF